MKELIKGSGIIFLFKIAGAGSLFLLSLLISNFYGALYLGVFSLVAAFLQIVGIFGKIGLDLYVIKIIPSLSSKSEVESFLQKVFRITFITSLSISLFYLIFSENINKYFFRTVNADQYIKYIAALCVPYTLFSIIPEIFRGFEEIKYYSFLRNLAQNLLVLVFLLFPLSSLIDFDPVFSYFYGTIAVFVISAVLLFKFLKRKGYNLFKYKKDYSRKIIKYSYPMLFTSSMLFLMGNVDTFMIGYYVDEKNVGFYSACIKISLLITFILASVSNYIIPKISKAYHEKRISDLLKIYRDSVKLITLSSLPIILVVLVLPEFFLSLFGEDFVQQVNVLYLVMAMNVISVIFGPLIYMLNMIDLQFYVKNVIFLSLIFNVLLNYLLIPRYGIEGAAIATLVSTLIWKSLLFFKLKRTIGTLKKLSND